jgi:hypothetical protein
MFKTIPMYPNYEADENSNIRGKRFGKVLRPKIKYGYSSVGIYTKQGYKWHNCHRLAAMAWLGAPENYEKMDVAHNDGDRSNNHIENLRWASRLENSHDRYAHGTARGARPAEDHHNAKLDIATVAKLRQRVLSGERFSDVHQDLGIKKLTAYDALTGKTWRAADALARPVRIKDVQNANL